MTRPSCYVAVPMTAYGTEHKAAALARLAALLPGWELVDPEGRYASNTAWLRGWRRLLPSLDMVVILPDADGYVGAGVLRESVDALFLRLPVILFDDGRRLVELESFDFPPHTLRLPARIGWPVAGAPIDLRSLATDRPTNRKQVTE